MAAGLDAAKLTFRDEDVAFLRSQKARNGQPLFAEDFLAWLRQNGDFSGISLSAIPEGRVVHPNVPLTVVHGPLAMAQILETALLNHLNFQTLIATKAARIREIGRGAAVDGIWLAARAWEGRQCRGARRVNRRGRFHLQCGHLAVLGYPPKGTHAHSMVQLFIAWERASYGAFRAYADVYPDDCTLLVDTIDTLESGIPNAIRVFEELRSKGHKPVGVRLDSGDLAFLSIQAARLLDAAGFPDVSIVLSNNLDELVIWQIITQITEEAPRYGVDVDHLLKRLVYGVGTRLITSWGEPALGGVYKLVAVCEAGAWIPALKFSESPAKTPNPGYKHVWRIYDWRGKATADLLSLQDEDPRQALNSATNGTIVLRHPSDYSKYRELTA